MLVTMLRATAIAALLLAGTATQAETDEKAEIDAAVKWADPMFGKSCDFARLKDDLNGSRYFEIKYRYKGQGQDEPDVVFPLIQLYCSAGAYNVSFLYLTKDTATEDYRVLSFAQPKLDYDYTDENFTKLKAAPKVTGYVARAELVNPDFDPKTNTIFMGAKWRGLGDAWSSGEWAFVEGEFVLKAFSVDPTYDLNADSPDGGEQQQSSYYQIYPELKLMDGN
jgi:hypothetical protein